MLGKKETKKKLFEGDWKVNLADSTSKCKESNLSALVKMTVYVDTSKAIAKMEES